jgi:hypothetical protein
MNMKKSLFCIVLAQLAIGSLSMAYASDPADQPGFLKEVKQVENSANADAQGRKYDPRRDIAQLNPNSFVRPLAPQNLPDASVCASKVKDAASPSEEAAKSASDCTASSGQ